MATWDIASFSQIWAALGITAVTDAQVDPIYVWDTTHPAANFPEAWPNATTWTDTWLTNGQRYTLSGATDIAGFTSTATPGNGKLAVSNGGRVLFCAFTLDDAKNGTTPIDADTDTKADANEMWQNFITYVLGH